jgi:hypothetical protein
MVAHATIYDIAAVAHTVSHYEVQACLLRSTPFMTSNEQRANPNLILPVGTQVVTAVEVRAKNGQPLRRSGTVAKIVTAPTDSKHAYTIRFPAGGETALHRHEIAIRKHVQNLHFDRSDAQLGDCDLYEHIIYRCVVGSRAYGLDVDGSDIFHHGEFERLGSQLKEASISSTLPEYPSGKNVLDDLLKRLRLEAGAGLR